MTKRRHLNSTLGAALTALVVCVAALVPADAQAASPGKRSKGSKHTRILKRRALLRQIRRNPRIALRPHFLRQAVDLNLDLPLTVRLNRATDASPTFVASDDILEIEWNDDTGFWPTGFSLPATTTADVSLSHGFTMEAHFGADTSGYGQHGVIETTQGQGVELLTASTTPVDVADYDPPCGFPTVRIDALSLGRGQTTQGILDLFNSEVRGRLHLSATVTSSVRPTCADDWVPAGTYTSTSSDPVLPVVLAGTFRISPALTADGRVRLGTISISDAVQPQVSSFARIRLCTQPGAPDCGLQSFSARLKLKTLTAELLLGQVAL